MQFQFKNDMIYHILLERIQHGVYPVGTKLPKETDFARELQVGKVTLRTALSRLENEKFIVRLPSRGTFVASKEFVSTTRLAIVLEQEMSPGSPATYCMQLALQLAARHGIVTEQIDSIFCEMLSEELLQQVFEKKKVDGILLFTCNFTGEEPLLKKLQSLHLPVILPLAIVGDCEKSGFASVLVNQRKEFEASLRFVLEQPWERIGIAGYYDGERNRCRDFSEEELRAYCGKRLTTLFYEPYDLEHIEARVAEIFQDRSTAPQVFLCYSDLFAILLMLALRKHGLRVPEDVSIVGFSGFNCDFRLDMELTGIKYPYESMVEKSIELFMQRSQWYPNGPVPEVVLPCQFVLGDSCRIVGASTKRAHRVSKAVVHKKINLQNQ